jgi:hypothetical protein
MGNANAAKESNTDINDFNQGFSLMVDREKLFIAQTAESTGLCATHVLMLFRANL